jgi:hypothetical protein
VACLLLDGKIASSGPRDRRDPGLFETDTALQYPPAFFEKHKITSSRGLLGKLQRYGSDLHPWVGATPELNACLRDTINSGVSSVAPFPPRVRALFEHPALRRLKTEPELGWMREVYPGATHSRWSHSVGVFSAIAAIYRALLTDPEVPTLRVIADPSDLNHALVAAIIHDAAQSSFGHDFEEAFGALFSHEEFVERLLTDTRWGDPLGKLIEALWRVDIPRVLAILRPISESENTALHVKVPIDALARDSINGPIDADKLDYLVRDSEACGVPYGRGIDVDRFLRALTVSAAPDLHLGARLVLAYRSKGRAAIESLLLARYQMYGAVYWHHAYRCLQAMFVHAVAKTFAPFATAGKNTVVRVSAGNLTPQQVQNLFYDWVLCGQPWAILAKQVPGLAQDFLESEPPLGVAAERALDFVWRFAAPGIRTLLERLAARDLYKRVFEIRVAELGQAGDYSELKARFSAPARAEKAAALQESLRLTIDRSLRAMANEHMTASDHEARDRLQKITTSDVPLVVLDFPTRGIPSELNIPTQLDDASRKYFVIESNRNKGDDNVFHVVRRLQMGSAALRIFAAPDLHELVIRYLTPDDIRGCVGDVLPGLIPG